MQDILKNSSAKIKQTKAQRSGRSNKLEQKQHYSYRKGKENELVIEKKTGLNEDQQEKNNQQSIHTQKLGGRNLRTRKKRKTRNGFSLFQINIIIRSDM